MPAAAPDDDFRTAATASRLWWAVPAVGLILLVLFGILFGGGPQKVSYGTSYDASDGGFRAAYLLLEQVKYPVERSRRPPAGGGVRWVLYPSEVNEKDARTLDEWVRGGGLALLAVDNDDLTGKIGLTVAVRGGIPPPPKQLAALMPMPTRFHQKGEVYTAQAPDVERLLAGHAEATGPPGGQTWGRVGGRPLVTIHPRGRGEYWLLSRPDVLANDNLRGEDNAILTVRLADAMLAERPGRLTFDEYLHGLRDRPTVTDLLFRMPALAVTLQVLFLGALVVWQSVVRFGLVRAARPPARRSKEEFLEAMTELLARKGDRAEAFRTVRDEFARRLEESLGLPAGTPPVQVAKEAARRRGVAELPLRDLLAADAPPGGSGQAAFVAAIQQVEAAARDCLPVRRG